MMRNLEKDGRLESRAGRIHTKRLAAVMLDTFPETRWLANLISVADMDTSAEDGAPPDASTREAEHAS